MGLESGRINHLWGFFLCENIPLCPSLRYAKREAFIKIDGLNFNGDFFEKKSKISQWISHQQCGECHINAKICPFPSFLHLAICIIHAEIQQL